MTLDHLSAISFDLYEYTKHDTSICNMPSSTPGHFTLNALVLNARSDGLSCKSSIKALGPAVIFHFVGSYTYCESPDTSLPQTYESYIYCESPS